MKLTPRLAERRTDRALITYFPDARHAQRVLDNQLSIYPELAIRPNRLWFQMEGRADWTDYLSSPAAGSAEISVSARKTDVGKISVDWVRPEGGGLRITASLADDGNVVGYEVVPGKSVTVWRRGEYKWTRDTRGRVSLKHMKFERSLSNNPSKPDQTYEIDITHFDPDAAIPASRFDIASLNVPADATFEEVSSSGSKVYKGSRPRSLDEAALKKLSEKLKSRGFAREKEAAE